MEITRNVELRLSHRVKVGNAANYLGIKAGLIELQQGRHQEKRLSAITKTKTMN